MPKLDLHLHKSISGHKWIKGVEVVHPAVSFTVDNNLFTEGKVNKNRDEVKVLCTDIH